MGKSINDMMVELASKLQEQLGDGYFSQPVEGFVIAFSVPLQKGDEERLRHEHNVPDSMNKSYAYGGTLHGHPEHALAGILVPADKDGDFIGRLTFECLMLRSKMQRGSALHTTLYQRESNGSPGEDGR